MNADEIVRELRTAAAKWEAKNKFIGTGELRVHDALNDAADLIESLQAQLAKKDTEIKRLNDEPPAYKFYYCESEDSYLLGRRLDTLYYAHWNDGCGFAWDMSRYLPWGEHVVAPRTVWKEHTYPSEPKEINLSEWFKGFLAQRLSASQRREMAAVEDIPHDCWHCVHKEEVASRACVLCVGRCQDGWQWRGPQEAGEGDNNGNVR